MDSNGVIRWEVGDMPNGDQQRLLVEVRVTRPGTIVNTAVVDSVSIDPNLSNNPDDAVISGAYLPPSLIGKRFFLTISQLPDTPGNFTISAAGTTPSQPLTQSLAADVGTATVGVFNPATATWYLRDGKSAGAPTQQTFSYGFGTTPVVGDWDGDGRTSIGVYDPGTARWFLRDSNDAGAPTVPVFAYGFGGAIPVVGDWDGDGTDSIGVYDPTTARWYLRNSNDAGAPDVPVFAYGFAGGIPVVGDWDGDGDDTIGIYNPATAEWFLRDSNDAGAPSVPVFAYGFGSNPVVGDWDGDGSSNIGVYNPATAQWFLRASNTAGAPTVPVFAYGFGTHPVVGDWDFAAPLRAVSKGPGGSAPALSAGQLQDIVAAALDRLTRIGLDSGTVNRLAATRFEIGNLPGTYLGLTDQSTQRVTIDADAAGHGWFVDATPQDDAEFLATDGPATGHMDLLSAVVHELGHVAGLDHDSGLMAETLAPGARSLEALDAFFAR